MVNLLENATHLLLDIVIFVFISKALPCGCHHKTKGGKGQAFLFRTMHICVQASVKCFHKTFTGGKFIHWSVSIERAVSSTHTLDRMEDT